MPLILALSVLATHGGLLAQEKTWPKVEKFAEDITGVIWDLRGTNSLKHLRYDGESFHAVTSTGQSRSKYQEHAFVDDGVFQIVFSNDRSAWYFVSDDKKLMTPANVSGAVEFQAQEGTAIKPVKNFPQDIQGVVWTGQNGPVELKLRWNGTDFEVGAKQGDAWHLERADAVVANRRVLEIGGEGGAVVWIAFSEDGTEAWWLTVTDIFGGQAQPEPEAARLSVADTGLSPQQNDLANHAEDLAGSGDLMRTSTLLRELKRKNAAKKDTIRKLETRFKALKP